MIKKFLSLIFLVSVFFVGQMKTMEDPNFDSANVESNVPSLVSDTESNQQLSSYLENMEHLGLDSTAALIEEHKSNKQSFVKSVDTLKKLAELAVCKYKDSKNLDLSCLPQELVIDLHCSSLEKFKEKEYEWLRITEKNLNRHNKLLCILADMGVNIKLMVSAIYNYFAFQIEFYKQDRFNSSYYISLKDINLLLALLVKWNNTENTYIEEIASEEEMDCLNKIISYAFSDEGNSDLWMLLTTNKLLSIGNNIGQKQAMDMPNSANFKTGTLQFKAASKLLEAQNANDIPKVLQPYCKYVEAAPLILPLIKKYFECLEQLKYGGWGRFKDEYKSKEIHKSLKITEENLAKCDELLYELICMGINIKPILFILHDYFYRWVQWDYDINKEIRGPLTLEDWNVMLAELIKCKLDASYNDAFLEELVSEEEMDNLERIIGYAFMRKYLGLHKFLAHNGLLPSLNYIFMNSSNMGVSILDFICWDCIDIEFFNFVINKEKNKKYNFRNLFRTQGCRILKKILLSRPSVGDSNLAVNKLKAFLQFMGKEAKAIINMRDEEGNTLLMHPELIFNNEEIIKLLIDNGADATIRNKGKTALNLAEDMWKASWRWIDVNSCIGKRCIQVLKEAESRCNQNKKQE